MLFENKKTCCSGTELFVSKCHPRELTSLAVGLRLGRGCEAAVQLGKQLLMLMELLVQPSPPTHLPSPHHPTFHPAPTWLHMP
jgi:hypothetical protein